MKASRINNLHLKIFWLFLLLLPTQITKHFWPEFAYVSGLPIDYLSPVIYLTDILLAISFTLWILSKKIKFSLNRTIVFVALIASVNIIFSLSPLSTLFQWLRIAQAYLSFYYVANNVKNLNWFIKPLLLGIVLTFILSIGQIFTGNNVGGIFTLFGERPLNVNSPGIALMEFDGQIYLRPYATFPHPNALAGYAGAVMLLLIAIKNKIKINKNIFYLSVFLCTVMVVLTYSQAALIALLLSLVIYASKSNVRLTYLLIIFILSSFLLLLIPLEAFTDNSIVQRLELNAIAKEVIATHPLLGVGLGQFVRMVPMYSHSPVWWIQPVHNIPLLLTTELGIIGVVGIALAIKKQIGVLRFTYYGLLIFIVITAMGDHYWLTSHQNILLLAVIIGTHEINNKQ